MSENIELADKIIVIQQMIHEQHESETIHL